LGDGTCDESTSSSSSMELTDRWIARLCFRILQHLPKKTKTTPPPIIQHSSYSTPHSTRQSHYRGLLVRMNLSGRNAPFQTPKYRKDRIVPDWFRYSHPPLPATTLDLVSNGPNAAPIPRPFHPRVSPRQSRGRPPNSYLLLDLWSTDACEV